MAIRKFDLTDEEWNLISSDFVTEKKKGRPFSDIRRTLNGIIWVKSTNATWRDLPKRYGNYNSVYKIYKKWLKDGKLNNLQKINIYLTAREEKKYHGQQN